MAAAPPLSTGAVAALEAIERVACEDRSIRQVVDEIVHCIARATGGKLSRSARYRALSAAADLEDELRAVLYAGGRPWGKLQLNRLTGAEPFTEADRAFLRAVAPLAGSLLRRAMLEAPAEVGPTRGPGVLVVDAAGTVISATAEADAWLQELSAGLPERSSHLDIDPELLLMPLRTLAEPGAPARRIRLRKHERHVAGRACVVTGGIRPGGDRDRARHGLRDRLDRGRGLSPDRS